MVPSALTTHATGDCGGAAGGRGTHGAALVLSCHERQQRRSQPSTTLSRRLRAESSCTMFTGDGRGDGAGVQSEGPVKGGAGRAEEGRTEGTDRPQGGEAQAVEELQRAWADLRSRQERVERARREGGRQEEGRGQEGTPLVPFRQPAIPPEQEGEMQERAWRRIRGEAAKLAERDREVAARERRVRGKEEAMARGAHRALPDPEGHTPSTDEEGRSRSEKRAREEKKRRRGRRRGSGAGGRSEGQGRRRGRRGRPAPA